MTWSCTSACPLSTRSVFQNEHLYVSCAAFKHSSLIWRRFRFKAFFQRTHAGLQLHTPPIGHMQPHVCTFAPSDSAYSRAVCRAIMAAIMRLSNIAMAYVHINCGEWRRLLHHVAPCSFTKRLQIEPCSEETTQQLDHWTFWTYRISPTVLNSTEKRKKRGKRASAVMQESVASTEGGGLCWKRIKYGSRVSPQGAWIFTFLSRNVVFPYSWRYCCWKWVDLCVVEGVEAALCGTKRGTLSCVTHGEILLDFNYYIKISIQLIM